MKKNISGLSASILLFGILIAFSSCEHNVSMETTVHEDGTIDKVIVLETADTTNNFFGIGTATGWKMTTDLIRDTTKEQEDEKRWRARFEKSFPSAEQANEELATPSDTLFRVSSKLEKRFKWFYTYLTYSDTYHAINRMDFPLDDYVTKEDYQFIDRLPAEGAIISKADSLYLSRLHEKLFDIYGVRAIFEAYYHFNENLIRESGLENRWLDTLKKHKENLFAGINNKKDVPYDFLYKAMDSLGIPIPYDKMQVRYDELSAQMDSRTTFINHASEGKYTHIINMPWPVTRTNADSVAGNRLQWNPPSIKFLIKDYTMYAESRKMNLWAIIVSAAVLLFTAYLFWRRSKY